MPRVQADRVRVRSAARERQIVRVRRERVQLREELEQVLRRLRQDTRQHDSARTGAPAAHTVVGAVPAGRSADRADHVRQDDGAAVRDRGHPARRPDAEAEDEGRGAAPEVFRDFRKVRRLPVRAHQAEAAEAAAGDTGHCPVAARRDTDEGGRLRDRGEAEQAGAAEERAGDVSEVCGDGARTACLVNGESFFFFRSAGTAIFRASTGRCR